MDYEPEQFPGAIFRIINPTKATIILFKNGKMICAGTKTEAKVKKGRRIRVGRDIEVVYRSTPRRRSRSI